MTWEIVPFFGVGQIKFGMSPDEVFIILGTPDDVEVDDSNRVEFRDLKIPIVRYRGDKVTEIEMFYDVNDVILNGMNIFKDNGIFVMKRFEELNGGAEISVGIVLFRNLGITSGRLDEDVQGEHSVTAFARGLWDNNKDFVPISFKA